MSSPVSRRQWITALEALPLAGLAARFFVLVARKQILYYVHPRWLVLLFVGWTLIFALSIHHAVRHMGHPQIRSRLLLATVSAWTLWLVVLPVVALTSSTAASNGGVRESRTAQTTVVLPDTTDDKAFNYWFNYFFSGAPRPELEGKSFHATGYLASYDAEKKTFELGRMVITCCTADGFMTSFTVAPTDSAKNVSLVSGEWYDVRGTWHKTKDGKWQITATVIAPVPVPEEPYVYP